MSELLYTAPSVIKDTWHTHLHLIYTNGHTSIVNVYKVNSISPSHSHKEIRMGMSNIFFLGIRASEKKIGDQGDVTYKDTDSSDTDESTFSAIPASTKKDTSLDEYAQGIDS